MITSENYEEYIMMYVDGELTATEEKALHNFLDLNPELKNELRAYELTKLSPGSELIFADKNALLKSMPVKKVIVFPQWIKYGVAACIAALVFFSILKFTGGSRYENEVAKKGQVPSQREPQVALASNNKAQPSQKTAATDDTGEIKAATPIRSNSFVAKRITRTKKDETEKHDQGVAVANTVPAKTTVNQVVLTEIKPLPCSKPEAKKLTVKDVPSVAATENNTESKRTFWDKLPIDEIKKKELENISNGVANTYQELNSVKKDVDEKTLTIKIEKRKLILSF